MTMFLAWDLRARAKLRNLRETEISSKKRGKSLKTKFHPI